MRGNYDQPDTDAGVELGTSRMSGSVLQLLIHFSILGVIFFWTKKKFFFTLSNLVTLVLKHTQAHFLRSLNNPFVTQLNKTHSI